MPSPLTIHVVRHGQTDYNLEKRYAGRTDVPLNDTGRAQATDLIPLVIAAGWPTIISSPLKRALETATIIANGLNASHIKTADELMERSLGVYEGLTKEEAAERYPELYARGVTRLRNDAPTNGETPCQVDERIRTFMNRLPKDSVASNFLLVTHGFVAKAIDLYFHPDKSEEEYFSFSVPNAQLMSYEIKRELKIVSF
jgi:probable phosphoglycerate mutase